MENNSQPIKIKISELLSADQLLSCLKKDIESFSNTEIAIATDPQNGYFHFIKSEYFWKIFLEKISKNNYSNLLVMAIVSWKS